MSDNYRALTRKYRPQSFDDIVSQEHVSNTLVNAIKQNRLSHAYMFCGPRGVGKTTMARVLARMINEVDNKIDGEDLGQTLNIIEMDAASNNKVEDIHHLREAVRIPPQNGRYKVFIVDEVHMLSKQAFNALLKTLEEPPKHAIFIFATTEPHKVLPTILSRVQRFDFKRISVTEMVERLKVIAKNENITIDNESLHVIAKKADGALRDALGLMDQAIAFCGDNITYNELLQALNVVGIDRLFEFMACVKEHDSGGGLELINTLLEEGYDIQEFLIGLTEHLRNLYVALHSQKMYMVEASEETKELYKKSAADFSKDDLMRMLHIVSEAQIKIKDASQPKILFEITLLKLIHMERTVNLNNLLAELDALKKNSNNLSYGSVNEETATEKTAAPAEKPQNIEQNLASETDDATITTKIARDEVNETATYGIDMPTLKRIRKKKEELVVTKLDGANDSVKITVEEQISVENKILSLDDIHQVWPEYIEQVKSANQSILHLQIERAKIKHLNGSLLTLECEDPFAMRILKEQISILSKTMKQCLGSRLQFKFELSATPSKKSKAANPYERFKEIQQKDPIIKDIVERFGAELQY